MITDVVRGPLMSVLNFMAANPTVFVCLSSGGQTSTAIKKSTVMYLKLYMTKRQARRALKQGPAV